jgi:uncharacterized protein
MLKVCFYHSVDLDGHCSGAIFKRVFSKMWEREGHQLKLIPYNYHNKIDMSEIQGADVYFIDCSPQPLEDVLPALILATHSVTIIDHHKSLLENATFTDAVIQGKVKMYGRIGLGACALAWEYWANVLGSMPTSVRWLAEYDAWVNHDKTTWDLMIMPFQYGMRLYQTDPRKSENDKFWLNLFDNALPVETILLEGKAVLKYEQNRLSRLARSGAFECVLDEYKVLAVNSCAKSSMTLESLFDPTKHDLMCVYNQLPDPDKSLVTIISFYTTKDGIDCSEVAKRYGGGGHMGAAGCRVKSLGWVGGRLELERF